MRLLASTCLATVLLMPQGVAAQVVEDPNDSSKTLDSSTNLAWLDINQTTNRSFLDVSGQFGPGGAFEGWRYATKSEVMTFFTNAGIDVTNAVDSYAAISGLMTLVGTTETSFGFTYSRGLVSDTPAAGKRDAPTLMLEDPGSYSAVAQQVWGEAQALPNLGSWLVQDASTPDPPDPDPIPTAEPHDMCADLMDDVRGLGLQKGLTNSLLAKLRAAMKNMTDGNNRNDGGAVGPLSAFIHEVDAQTGKRLTSDQASDLSDDAQAIIDALTS